MPNSEINAPMTLEQHQGVVKYLYAEIKKRTKEPSELRTHLVGEFNESIARLGHMEEECFTSNVGRIE